MHEPYTAYAHWMLLRRILNGAGVERLQANMAQSSMSRAAFLCAYVEEVRQGVADAFFVRYTKYQTVDEWIEHPLPTMNEPHKAMAWLTAREDIEENRMVDMYLKAGLARIDNVFMMSRRLFQLPGAPGRDFQRAQHCLAWLRAL